MVYGNERNTKADLMRELSSPMTTDQCELDDHRDLTEYERNPAKNVANLVVKRLFRDGEEQ